MNKESFQTAENDQTIATRIAKIKEDTITFANNQLKEHQQRDDYKELLELSIIFVGRIPSTGISFKNQEPVIEPDGWQK